MAVSADDFARFLADRYDEAEALAKSATSGPWYWTEARNDTLDGDCGPELKSATAATPDGYPETVLSGWGYDDWGLSVGDSDKAHIAANDPAHRLADIALKRAILAEHPHARTDRNWTGRDDLDGPFGCSTCDFDSEYGQGPGGWCATVRQLGTEFDGHPAYKEGWKP